MTIRANAPMPCGWCGKETDGRLPVGTMPNGRTVYVAACEGECSKRMAPGGRNHAALRRELKRFREEQRRVDAVRRGLPEPPIMRTR